MTMVAIIAGAGILPRLIAEDAMRSGRKFCVVLFDGFSPDWAQDLPIFAARFEAIGQMMDGLRNLGCDSVTFAGAMARPVLDFARLDSKSRELLMALMQGDDAMLRNIAAFFEREGFRVVGAHEILANLLVPVGILTRVQPSQTDQADAARGMAIVAALGAADVGQAAVVAQGICLGVESIQGTNALLEFVAATGEKFKPDPRGAKGVLCKAPKPGQDWRMDLPAIGMDTIGKAAAAGIGGVALQAGGVIALDLAAVVAEADRLGLFLFGREGR